MSHVLVPNDFDQRARRDPCADAAQMRLERAYRTGIPAGRPVRLAQSASSHQPRVRMVWALAASRERIRRVWDGSERETRRRDNRPTYRCTFLVAGRRKMPTVSLSGASVPVNMAGIQSAILAKWTADVCVFQ